MTPPSTLSRMPTIRTLTSVPALTRTRFLRQTRKFNPSFLTSRTRTHSTSPSPSSVSTDELSHFSALASSWWDPMGPSRVLHLMNPLRHDFIAECLAESPPPGISESTAGANLHYLDVGCGGGIFAESLARTISATTTTTRTSTTATATPTPTRAASITAIDPSPSLIKIARAHARQDPKVYEHLQSGKFKYCNTTLEELIQTSSSPTPPTPTNINAQCENEFRGGYDVITLFEVLEHIDPTSTTPLTFLTNCLSLLRPGGWLIGSTIARSWPSFLVNQVVAEAPWPIGVVPRGTHEWRKFVDPGEVRGWVQEGIMRNSCSSSGSAGKVMKRSGSEALHGTKWVCRGVVYFPGFGWKMVDGMEDWGNYFWAVRRGV